MSYLTWQYYLLLLITVILYYLLPVAFRWISLLAGSICFYTLFMGRRLELVLFLTTILVSWLFGLFLERAAGWKTRKRQILLFAAILICAGPLLVIKTISFLKGYTGFTFSELIVPVGISFYTVQIIAYLADVYKGKIKACGNPCHFALFVSFFPQIVQGPIPRYEQTQSQLLGGITLEMDNLRVGFYRILWGAFLKYMIADKAAVYVNEIFGQYRMYAGFYVLAAAVLYSLQLYTDFLACVMISRGSARLFGIELPENFMRPYMAVSIRDFWRRWHMTFSAFLRDYVYIPLGGSRKGKLRRYFNILITFLVSGFWHGDGLHFIAWGLLNGIYQIVGGWTLKFRTRIYALLRIPEESFAWRLYKRVSTFALVTLAWVLFRSSGIGQALTMLRNMVSVYNPWVLFDGSIEKCGGMDLRQWNILLMSTAALVFVSVWEERRQRQETDRLSAVKAAKHTDFGTALHMGQSAGGSEEKAKQNMRSSGQKDSDSPAARRDGLAGLIIRQHVTVRFLLCAGVILFILLFGTYGYGFSAGSFIYGGF